MSKKYIYILNKISKLDKINKHKNEFRKCLNQMGKERIQEWIVFQVSRGGLGYMDWNILINSSWFAWVCRKCSWACLWYSSYCLWYSSCKEKARLMLELTWLKCSKTDPLNSLKSFLKSSKESCAWPCSSSLSSPTLALGFLTNSRRFSLLFWKLKPLKYFHPTYHLDPCKQYHQHSHQKIPHDVQ